MPVRKVLALVASPRKGGNCDLLVGLMMQGCKEQGLETETLYLADHELKPCVQCEACHEQEVRACVIKDGFGPIAEKLRLADVIVIATPIWWSGVHASLKLLIDRGYSLFGKNFSDFQLRGKGVVVVACQAQDDLELYVNPLVKEFKVYEEWLKFRLIDSLVASADIKGDVLANHELIAKAVRLGRDIAGWRNPSDN